MPSKPVVWQPEQEDVRMRHSETLNPPPARRPVHSSRQVLARKSKSFSWAARLFDRPTADDVAILYHFCRLVDDIADHQSVLSVHNRLAVFQADLEYGDSEQPELRALIEMARRRRMDLKLPRLLVEAVRADTGNVRLACEHDLLRYAYGVASTVGLMMCAVMGVRNPAAKPFAVDLGIAMQLTNIARDVVEDAWRGRRYLPGEWLGTDLPPARIRTGSPEIQKRIRRARERLLDLAAAYYRSAERGMRFIPWRARLAVLTAAHLYEGIGDRLHAGDVPWGQRAVVGRGTKVRKTLWALGQMLFNPVFWNVGRRPAHAARLHRALAGLPGVNGGRP